MQIKIKFIAIIIFLILTASCSYEKISMPELDNSDIIFNTGDERYIQVNPEWGGAPWNFNDPNDIFISEDDYIYVADSARIIVLSKSGDVITSDNFGNDFSAIATIPNIDDPAMPINPTGLCLDSKLNLYVVDNSKNIYVWNQYINNIKNSNPDGVDSIATQITYRNNTTGENVILTPREFYLSVLYDFDEDYSKIKVTFISDPAAMDSIYKPHVFYTEFKEEGAEFVSVAAAPFGTNYLYVSDGLQQRIAAIYVGRSSYLKLRNGVEIWQHKGIYDYDAATAGTGAGTVNDPTGMAVDEGGNIYYTQTGENFGLHKISYSSSSGWSSSFALDVNEIMDLDRFAEPFDVATSPDGSIFIVDKAVNEVQVYDNIGNFIRKAGTRFAQSEITVIDSIYVDGVLNVSERDTIITTEYSDVLDSPKSVVVDDDMVYIVDSGNNRIVRYQLSTGLDIDLDEELGH